MPHKHQEQPHATWACAVFNHSTERSQQVKTQIDAAAALGSIILPSCPKKIDETTLDTVFLRATYLPAVVEVLMA
jgi:hypothetical protein